MRLHLQSDHSSSLKAANHFQQMRNSLWVAFPDVVVAVASPVVVPLVSYPY